MKWLDLTARVLLGLTLASLPFVHYRCGGSFHSHVQLDLEGVRHADSTP
jgi:hypothetical protein